MKNKAEEILKMFKLAFDVKTRYPEILKKMLDSEQITEENYFLTEYSKKFKNDFFETLQPKHFSGQNRQWLYIKLQTIKYLKEVDSYIIPPG